MGGMPKFLDQNRPAKVKEIYSALKRDHPDMPAEMKARIASRRGKKNAMSRKSPKDGGPKYKAPITLKYKAASYSKKLEKDLEAEGKRSLSGGNLNLENDQKLMARMMKESKLKRSLQKRASDLRKEAGKGKGLKRVASRIIHGPKAARSKAQIELMNRSVAKSVGQSSKGRVVDDMEKLKAQGRKWRSGSETLFPKNASIKLSHALQERASDLRNDIVNRAMSCGEGLEKTAAEQYFHDLRKPDQDVEMLGAKFCKLAHGIGRDPWELALEVADHFPAYAMLSKTASDPKARELAEFYLDWSDEMEKTAFLGALGKGLRVAKAGMGQAAKNVKGMTSSGKMQQAIAGGRKRTIGSATKREAKNVDKITTQGGGSYGRGQNVLKQRQAEIAAAKAPKTRPQASAAPTQAPGAIQQAGQKAMAGMGTAAKTAIGAGAVGAAVGVPGYAYLKYQQGQQPQAQQGYYR